MVAYCRWQVPLCRQCTVAVLQHQDKQMKSQIQINQGHTSSVSCPLQTLCPFSLWLDTLKIDPFCPCSLLNQMLTLFAPPMKFPHTLKLLIQRRNAPGANLSTHGFKDYLTHSFQSVNSTLSESHQRNSGCHILWVTAQRSSNERRRRTEMCLAACRRPPLVEKIPPEPNPPKFPVDFLGFCRFIRRDVVRWMEYQAHPHH